MVVPLAFLEGNIARKEECTMAVINTPQSGRLTVSVVETVAGKETIHARNFAGLKPAASDQDVYDVGNAIAGLQKMSLVSISRTNASDLTSA